MDHIRVNKMKYKTYSSCYYCFVFLLILQCFQLVVLPYFVDYLSFFALLYFSFSNYKKTKTIYTKPILYFSFFLTVSFVYSYVVRNQNFFVATAHNYLYYGLLLFFFYIKCNPSVEQSEKILITLSVIYCCCYLIQYFIYPTIIFRAAENVNVNDNFFRMRLNGAMVSYLLMFLGINKFMINKNSCYLLLCVLGAFPVVIMGFRSLISVSLISICVMIPVVARSSCKTFLYILVLSIMLISFMQTDIVRYKVEEMLLRNETDSFSDGDYIRFLSLKYYLNYFDSPLDMIIGAGIPTDLNSNYTKDIYRAISYYGFYWMDLGVVGLWLVIGAPAVLLLLYMVCYTIVVCKWTGLQYIRFALVTILLGSLFTTMELYRPGNLLVMSLLFYIVHKKQIDHSI